MVSTLTSMGLSDTSQPRGSKINPLEISKTVVIKAPFFAMGWLISSLKKYFLISSYLWFQQNGRGVKVLDENFFTNFLKLLVR